MEACRVLASRDLVSYVLQFLSANMALHQRHLVMLSYSANVLHKNVYSSTFAIKGEVFFLVSSRVSFASVNLILPITYV